MKRAAVLAILLLFPICYHIISPEYIGDTIRYAGDVVGHIDGRAAQFWEFGHLLWRPSGFLGYWLLGHRYTQWFGDTPTQAVVRVLIQTNFICSMMVLVLLYFLLLKISRAWIAAGVALSMSCTAGFLNYSHSGTPYIPALLFSVLTLCLSVRAVEAGYRYAFLAGLSFTVACALWFPFSFSGCGVLALLYLWPSRAVAGTPASRLFRRQLMAVFLATLVVSTLLLFAGGAAAEGVRTAGRLRHWIQEADNGVTQSRNTMRAVTGLARSTWVFGNDTVLLKRRLFSDPYNPVATRTVAVRLGGKLAVFYLGFGALLWVLWREHRSTFLILAAAGFPLLFFAVIIFEPSAPERFMPAFPFVYLGIAAVLDNARRHMVAAGCIVVLLSGTVVVNLALTSSSAGVRVAETKRRIQALDRSVQPGALICVLTMFDDLFGLPANNPLNAGLTASRFHVYYTIQAANSMTPAWRTEFAREVQAQWARNQEVWISERLLAKRPDSRWLWVEGDDRRIHWPEIPATFERLEYDAKVLAGSDGFLRLAQSRVNRDWLAKQLGLTTVGAIVGPSSGCAIVDTRHSFLPA